MLCPCGVPVRHVYGNAYGNTPPFFLRPETEKFTCPRGQAITEIDAILYDDANDPCEACRPRGNKDAGGRVRRVTTGRGRSEGMGGMGATGRKRGGGTSALRIVCCCCCAASFSVGPTSTRVAGCMVVYTHVDACLTKARCVCGGGGM